jgi:hypothetical protein
LPPALELGPVKEDAIEDEHLHLGCGLRVGVDELSAWTS